MDDLGVALFQETIIWGYQGGYWLEFSEIESFRSISGLEHCWLWVDVEFIDELFERSMEEYLIFPWNSEVCWGIHCETGITSHSSIGYGVLMSKPGLSAWQYRGLKSPGAGNHKYPLVMTSHEKPPFWMGRLTISMAIFNSYVKLPEGIYLFFWLSRLYRVTLCYIHTDSFIQKCTNSIHIIENHRDGFIQKCINTHKHT